jgi:hypothetical protein
VAVDFQDVEGRRATSFRIGDRLKALVLTENLRSGCAPAITFKNALGQVVNVTYFEGMDAARMGRRVLFTFDVELALEAGRYGIQAHVGEPVRPNVGPLVCETPALGPIAIEWNYESDRPPFYGMVGLPATVTAEGLKP